MSLRRLTAAVLVVCATAAHIIAQETPARIASSERPFAVGEEMQYDLRAKWFVVTGKGTASLRVEAIDTVHGFPTYRLVMAMKGGISAYHIDDVHKSWLDTAQLFSRRFYQKIDQTTFNRDRTFDFYPDSMRYADLAKIGRPDGTAELASAQPLDDVSFLYYMRMVPLEVGREYSMSRYYKSEGNPVSVRVLRTERITVPAGEFPAIVIRPTIRTDNGLFSKGGEAEVWLSNDARRIPLKVRAKISIATMTMELRSYTPGR
jgi:hypothetical protein